MQALGEYQLLEQIGDGHMGKIFVAQKPGDGRQLVVKLFRRELTPTPQSRVEACDQMRAFGRVVHPNIAATVDVREFDQQVAQVREHLSGQTLKARVHTHGPMTWTEATAVGAKIASALNAGHRFSPSQVHGDIKPGNIFLTTEGVKVIDMGLARMFSRSQGEQTNQSLGEVQYMSPEEIDGEVIDGRSDLYQLGLVLYEALAGHPPFQGRSVLELLTAQATQEPPPLPNNVPIALRELIKRLLAKRQDDRPGTAAEVVALLEAIGEGESISMPTHTTGSMSISASIPSMPAAPQKPSNAPVIIAIAALVGLALVVVVAAVVIMVLATESEPEVVTVEPAAEPDPVPPPEPLTAPKRDLGSAGTGEGGETGTDDPPPKLDLGTRDTGGGLVTGLFNSAIQNADPGTQPMSGFEARVATTDGSVTGHADADLKSAIGTRKRRIDACFARFQFTEPVHERVEYSLIIDDEGKVLRLSDRGERERCKPLDACLDRAFLGLELGAPPTPGVIDKKVDVTLSSLIRVNPRL